MGRDISSMHQPLAEVLDHASEFVSVVYARAPDLYERLLASGRFSSMLEQDNNFNHGKLFAYAEYLVFRAEFLQRFPEASAHASINAFSKLFLKNDISITNLVNALEAPAGEERLYLRGERSPAEGPD